MDFPGHIKESTAGYFSNPVSCFTTHISVHYWNKTVSLFLARTLHNDNNLLRFTFSLLPREWFHLDNSILIPHCHAAPSFCSSQYLLLKQPYPHPLRWSDPSEGNLWMSQGRSSLLSLNGQCRLDLVSQNGAVSYFFLLFFCLPSRLRPV